MTDERQVIVVGSGPCGATAARELVRLGIPVTMLEAGEGEPAGLLVRAAGRNLYRRMSDKGVQNRTRHIADGDPRTAWISNLSPGGLSNQWTGGVPRLAPEDFEDGAAIHERYRWPLKYDDLAPYYERTERLMGITAGREAVPNLPLGYADFRADIPADWRPIARLAERRGQGMTMLPLADGSRWMFVRRGTAFNSYATLVRPLLRSPHFHLITSAPALQLEWDGSRQRVTGVVYHDRNSGVHHRLSGAAVVVACGPLDSTALLLRSTSPDFPKGLGNSEGLLGRYLHDHMREWWVLDLERPIDLPTPSVYLTRTPYAESRPLIAASWTIGTLSSKDKLRSLVPLKSRTLGVQMFGTTVPHEDRQVSLDAEQKDSFGLPQLRIRMEYSRDEVCNMVQARDHLMSLLEEAGYRGTIREIVEQLYPGTSVHYGGTVRMHATRKHGVLDAWNRVYDCPNVIVADASCFTTGPEKNPTLTAMALAARAAERLASDLKAG